MNGEAYGKPVEHAIHKKLMETLNPVHLHILNESHMHNVPPGSETHFKVVVVSDKFNNLPLIKVQFIQ
jgi:BolA protein